MPAQHAPIRANTASVSSGYRVPACPRRSGICTASEDPHECPNDTEITGPCCDHTLMLSCVQTGSDECFTAYETCWC